MTWTLCTSGAAIHEAGANANSVVIASGALLKDYSDTAEALVCSQARYDVVTNYGTLTAQGKKIVQDIAASYVAQKIIKYDMSGYTTMNEAITMINILENTIDRNLKLIKDDKIKTYLVIT